MDRKRGACSYATFDGEGAAVLTNNLMRCGEPESGSFTDAIGMFGAEKRIENVFEMIGRDSASFVLDFQLHPRRVVSLRHETRMDLNNAVATGHCIQSIQQQIQQHLFDLLTIEQEQRELR